ncbi:sigma 54-interacting transcriptional regulator, partial [Burkholderia pseudomallei]
SRLLRVLEDMEFVPVGSKRIVGAKVRMIAARWADLAALVAEGGGGGPCHVYCLAGFAAGLEVGSAPVWLVIAWCGRSGRLLVS